MSEENELKKIKEKLTELEAQNKEYLEGWKRERADFLNYKKEEIERISSFIKYANEELIIKFLPVLDNIYLAEKELSEEIKNHKWIEGFLKIKQQIEEFLKSQGVQEIKVKIGEDYFNPNFHEIVGEIVEASFSPNNEEDKLKLKEPGVIAEEIQKGYKINGKVIRPAKVKIAK